MESGLAQRLKLLLRRFLLTRWRLLVLSFLTVRVKASPQPRVVGAVNTDGQGQSQWSIGSKGNVLSKLYNPRQNVC